MAQTVLFASPHKTTSSDENFENNQKLDEHGDGDCVVDGTRPVLRTSISKRRLGDQYLTPKRARVDSGGDNGGDGDDDHMLEEIKCGGESLLVSKPELGSRTRSNDVEGDTCAEPKLKQKRISSPSLKEGESINKAPKSTEVIPCCDLKAAIVCPTLGIIDALQKSDSNPNLIGDYSRPHNLPIIKGRHGDLQSISPETLASLINGHFRDRIASFKIIDSRFPYEYEGGHIKGAINIFHKSALIQELLSDQENTPPVSNKDSKSNQILIFHCEFSSERAPSLCRFLRSKDREFNGSRYPQLYHPEVYLLEGGYKAFFEAHKELCTPQQYLPMRSKDHQEQMRTCQSKRKRMEKEASKFSSNFKSRS